MRSQTSSFGLVAVTALCQFGCTAHHVEVTQYGKMQDVLGGGGAHATGMVALSDVLDQPHAIGVGALAGLEGEITIRDGQAWIARPAGDNLQIDGPTASSTEEAALLTVSYVEQWREVPVDDDLAGDALEAFIAMHAEASGLDPKEPFPFMLEGRLDDLQIHVINGACPMKPGARLEPEEQPWRLAVGTATFAEVVGIYAADSVGVLTHPGTAVHAHALLDMNGRTITGHIERLAIARGGTLMLPAQSRQ